MGSWRHTERGRGISHLEFFSDQIGAEWGPIIDCMSKNGYSFLAVEGERGMECLIVEWRWNPRSWDDFSYCVNREIDGSHFSRQSRGCPERILDQLDPVEKIFEKEWEQERARVWREACREQIALRRSRPSVSFGDTVRFSHGIHFTTGDIYDTFVWCGGATFELPSGTGRFHITDWRRLEYEVFKKEKDGEIALPPESESSLTSLLGLEA